MNRPTPEQILEIKAACRAKFGHERVIGIALGAPIDGFYVMAAFANVREFSAHVDATKVSDVQARSALIVDRCLWPSQADVAAKRADFPMLDAKIEDEFGERMGWAGGAPIVVPLTAATAPPGFAEPKDVAAKVLALQAAHPAAKLWSVFSRANGLAVIMASPSEDVFVAMQSTMAEAERSRRGSLLVVVDFTRDLVVWSPKPFDAHLDELPGRAVELAPAWPEIGGARAAASSSFL